MMFGNRRKEKKYSESEVPINKRAPENTATEAWGMT